jgi:O-6-methylguanine DNA methyltransferase
MPNQSEHDRYSFYYNRVDWNMHVTATRHGLREIVFLEDPLATFAADFYQYPDPVQRMFSNLQAELERYFNGETVQFTAALDWRDLSVFQKQVYSALQKVAYGSVVTYGDLARRIGSPGAARAVGTALHNNPLPLVVPCHRVVSSSGIGGFAAGLTLKRALLQLEGISGL